MQIYVLMDNLATPNFACEHGLSLLIKTAHAKILFDMGQRDLYLENAKLLGADIEDVDVAIISHGHYDHGGGLQSFMYKNHRAPIYIHKEAFGKHFAARQCGEYSFIGIPPIFQESPQIIEVSRDLEILDGVLLFSSVKTDRFLSKSNDALLVECLGRYQKDSFSHEQNLLVQENGKYVLFAGCAHCGIVNIIDRAMEIAGAPMDAVIGGFHLSNPSTCQCEPIETIEQIAEYLLSYPTSYYTCHCTGMEAYQHLKSRMGNRIHYITAGTVMEI
jgi:7,8-dihydropterin-6-yl-methyl-4-(beta-D-ribofuranosyl)aminobenzene 5'-phosphate synthase